MNKPDISSRAKELHGVMCCLAGCAGACDVPKRIAVVCDRELDHVRMAAVGEISLLSKLVQRSTADRNANNYPLSGLLNTPSS